MGTPDAAADGKSCSDSDPCTKPDKCGTDGKCHGTPDAAKCDDGNGCTLDSCVKVSTYTSKCEHKAIAAGGKCDDGDPCTQNDACTNGVCKGGNACKFTTLFTDDFACGKAGKWTIDPMPKSGETGWAVDDTPSKPAAHSPTCSLNFNNGKDYKGVDAAGKDAKVTGTATSAEIKLPADGVMTLSLWSFDGVEPSNSYDLRKVQVSEDAFKTTLKEWQLNNGENAGKWIEVKYDLTPYKGKQIQLRLFFDSKDTLNNTGPGWFVDDVQITVGTLNAG